MDDEIKQALDQYLDVYAYMRQKVDNDRVVALGLVQEWAKDNRAVQIQAERHNENATPKQVAYLQRLGVDVPKGLTKQQASQLIDEQRST